MTTKAHWEQAYSSRPSTELSWYEPTPAASLSFIAATNVPTDAAIIDVGGGASTLVDHLLDAGFTRLTILDIAPEALHQARNRLGVRGDSVTWLEGDVLGCELPSQSFDLWHDRAVFHFLTVADDQQRYVNQVRRALRVGGHLILATFANDGPSRCSGLDVVRYTPEELAGHFAGFDLVEQRLESHRTPAGREQRFIYCRFVHRGTPST